MGNRLGQYNHDSGNGKSIRQVPSTVRNERARHCIVTVLGLINPAGTKHGAGMITASRRYQALHRNTPPRYWVVRHLSVLTHHALTTKMSSFEGMTTAILRSTSTGLFVICFRGFVTVHTEEHDRKFVAYDIVGFQAQTTVGGKSTVLHGTWGPSVWPIPWHDTVLGMYPVLTRKHSPAPCSCARFTGIVMHMYLAFDTTIKASFETFRVSSPSFMIRRTMLCGSASWFTPCWTSRVPMDNRSDESTVGRREEGGEGSTISCNTSASASREREVLLRERKVLP